jgi:hypothetical protein
MILSNDKADTFLMQSLIDISHPQDEYCPNNNTQSQHPISPKFKIKQCLQAFFERATPVTAFS